MKNALLGVVIFFLMAAGCANYSRMKYEEWEQAYRDGKLTYFEKEQLKTLERQRGGVSPRYYYRGRYPGPGPLRDEIR